MSHPDFALDLDSRSVREVLRLRLASRGVGAWPCTRCGTRFPVDDSYTVRFGPTSRTYSFVVCPPCAERYCVAQPVTLDLDRVHRAGRDDEPVVRLARRVETQRSPAPDGTLTLRDSDVRVVAHQSERTPSQVLTDLAEQGLLAD